MYIGWRYVLPGVMVADCESRSSYVCIVLVVVVLVEEWVALLNLVVMVVFFAWLVVILIRWWTEYFEYSEFFVWIANSYVKWISFIISNYFVYIIFPKFITVHHPHCPVRSCFRPVFYQRARSSSCCPWPEENFGGNCEPEFDEMLLCIYFIHVFVRFYMGDNVIVCGFFEGINPNKPGLVWH